MSIRPVRRLAKAKPAIEGAGVHLRRAFGFGNTSDFDPFLLLDDFRNDVPRDYLAGLDRKSTRLNSSHVAISYAVFCLQNKNEKHRLYAPALGRRRPAHHVW